MRWSRAWWRLFGAGSGSTVAVLRCDYYAGIEPGTQGSRLIGSITTRWFVMLLVTVYDRCTYKHVGT
jgi:hypothetical protein